MKRGKSKPRNRVLVAATLIAGLTLMPAVSLAATNTGTGDISGVALTDGVFDLSSATLALVKNAFLLSSGAQLTSGDSVPAGTQVHFMIYLLNDTVADATDVSIDDVLDTGTFAYTVSSMVAKEIGSASTGVCPASVCDEAAIYADVIATGTPLGDGDSVALPVEAPADSGSWDGTDTLDWGDGSNGNNAQLDVSTDAVWAVVFTVTMQ